MTAVILNLIKNAHPAHDRRTTGERPANIRHRPTSNRQQRPANGRRTTSTAHRLAADTRPAHRLADGRRPAGECPADGRQNGQQSGPAKRPAARPTTRPAARPAKQPAGRPARPHDRPRATANHDRQPTGKPTDAHTGEQPSNGRHGMTCKQPAPDWQTTGAGPARNRRNGLQTAGARTPMFNRPGPH